MALASQSVITSAWHGDAIPQKVAIALNSTAECLPRRCQNAHVSITPPDGPTNAMRVSITKYKYRVQETRQPYSKPNKVNCDRIHRGAAIGISAALTKAIYVTNHFKASAGTAHLIESAIRCCLTFS